MQPFWCVKSSDLCESQCLICAEAVSIQNAYRIEQIVENDRKFNKSADMEAQNAEKESDLFPTQRSTTARDLRMLSYNIENSDDRDLVQQAADMIELSDEAIGDAIQALRYVVTHDWPTQMLNPTDYAAKILHKLSEL